MTKLKVLTVIGTRPEIIRASAIMKRFDELFDHTVVHTGQNYDFELNQIFFNELGLREPDYVLDSKSDNAFQQIGRLFSKLPEILDIEKPQGFFVLGDTNSCLSAYVAKRYQIPIFHFEAGNRCFDQRVPEEVNRKIVDHLADINLCYSRLSRDYLLAEGFPADRVFAVGSPMWEVIAQQKSKLDESRILDRFGLSVRQYIVLSLHREENVDSEIRLIQMVDVIKKLYERHPLPVVMSLHPRTKKNIKSFSVEIPDHVILTKPLGFHDYLRLQRDSFVVLSDSGTVNEEASILGFCALNLRDSHERPEAMINAVVPMTGFDFDSIKTGIEILLLRKNTSPEPVIEYRVPDVSMRVANFIISYFRLVNRVVWHK